MTEPKELPFVAYQHEVKAILKNGRVQFRRVMRPQPPANVTKIIPLHPAMGYAIRHEPVTMGDGITIHGNIVKCPYGQPGTNLWLKETFCLWDAATDEYEGDLHRGKLPIPNEHNVHFWKKRVQYRASLECDDESYKWRPSIHMPRWASRINLQMVDIKAEPIQQILTRVKETGSFDELFLAGMSQFASWDGKGNIPTPLSEFIPIWDKHNAGYSWESNPWVWVGEAILIK